MTVRHRIAFLAAVAVLVTACSGAHHPRLGTEDHSTSPSATPSATGSAPAAGAVQPGADATSRVGLAGLLPADRQAVWDPGLNPVGGIPDRKQVCATVQPSGRDDTAAIQAALDRCPPNHVVQLEAGRFTISGEGLYMTRSGVTLRGRGWHTWLVKTPGSNYPVISVGIHWYHYTQPVELAADALQGARSISLVRDPGLRPGEIVTVDEKTDPDLSVWNPDNSPPGNESRGWFGEDDRPIGQVMEVKAVRGASVSFTTPLHVGLLTKHDAHLVRLSHDDGGPVAPTVRYAGIEDLHVSGGEGGDGGGNIHLFATAYSWVKNVESDQSKGSSVNLDGAFRCVLRDSYLHSTLDPNPGGGGYGIALDNYAADNLIENNISWNFNKVMVMRTTGGGNVIGYNYMDDGWGAGYRSIVEVGLNASHMTTPHHELFEGNQSFNFDSDSVWGNSIYITAFRNDLTAQRRSTPPLQLTDDGNRRAIGLTTGHWWYSFIGNVLGSAGQRPGPGRSFVYQQTSFDRDDQVPMWKLGYNGTDGSAPQDPKVAQTTIRYANYDYVTNTTQWGDQQARTLPPSLYLTSKPAFFANQPWPWVTPDNPTSKLTTLPARQRFDAIHTSAHH
ncbi:MAG: hypothetical protein J2P16_07450 [Mycobacterium sp.]|nr:hypothetical protein [Mycobacterium sp.]